MPNLTYSVANPCVHPSLRARIVTTVIYILAEREEMSRCCCIVQLTNCARCDVLHHVSDEAAVGPAAALKLASPSWVSSPSPSWWVWPWRRELRLWRRFERRFWRWCWRWNRRWIFTFMTVCTSSLATCTTISVGLVVGSAYTPIDAEFTPILLVNITATAFAISPTRSVDALIWEKFIRAIL